MGKIRTKILGSEEEQEQKKRDKARREGKKQLKKTKISGMKGGERLPDMSPVDETAIQVEQSESQPPEEEIKDIKKNKKEEKEKKSQGRKYLHAKTFIDRTKKYPLKEVIKLVKKTSFTKFDGTVEVHINTFEKGIRGTVSLPFGTGKSIRVAVANDDIVKEIESGKINFDILITTPDMMPKLAKLARTLGPKGLMPNPKSGTITEEPDKLKEKLSKGQIQFKTEPEAPIIHSGIGKVSFEENKLEENLKSLVEAIGKQKIRSIILNCTMGPGIKLDLNSI